MTRLLIIIFLFANITFAQSSDKYFIYFKDKGIAKTSQLSKTSVEYSKALNSLSERSIKRRMKTLGENVITFEDFPIKEEYVKAVKESGAKIVWKLKWFNALSAIITEDQLQKIAQYNFVSKIEKVKTIKYKRDINKEQSLAKNVVSSQSDYKYNYGSSLTQLELSDVPIVHDAGITGDGVVIGILDAGFAWAAHPALTDREVLAEHDFVYGDGNTDDGDGSHGTAVFSLIGGFDEGKIVSPAFNSQFVLAKTEDVRSETKIEEDNYAAALEWMDSIGVDITSTSLGYNTFDNSEDNYTYADMDGKTAIVTRAAEFAFSCGILTITAAGNEGDNDSWRHITAPSDGINTIAVGAVSSSGNLASFSSVGPSSDGRIKPELVAQGVTCFHAKAYSNNYGYGGGTSYSTPIVSGIASQLLSAFPYLSNVQLRSILIEASDSTSNPNNKYGYGLLSAKSAVEFPNIEKDLSGDKYQINKIILDSLGVISDSLSLNFHVNSSEVLYNSKMEQSGSNKYFSSQSLPLIDNNLVEGDTISFYFEYCDSNYTAKRIPKEGSYKVIYNSVNVVLNLDLSKPIFPDKFLLSQNYPNPFNPTTQFSLSVPESNFITINIYNILGQKVRTLASKNFAKGVYNFSWNGLNDFGGKVASGVYIYTAISKSSVVSRKMMLVK